MKSKEITIASGSEDSLSTIFLKFNVKMFTKRIRIIDDSGRIFKVKLNNRNDGIVLRRLWDRNRDNDIVLGMFELARGLMELKYEITGWHTIIYRRRIEGVFRNFIEFRKTIFTIMPFGIKMHVGVNENKSQVVTENMSGLSVYVFDSLENGGEKLNKAELILSVESHVLSKGYNEQEFVDLINENINNNPLCLCRRYEILDTHKLSTKHI